MLSALSAETKREEKVLENEHSNITGKKDEGGQGKL